MKMNYRKDIYEKVKFMLIQLNRTDKVLAEYDSLEEMIEDGWCMGT